MSALIPAAASRAIRQAASGRLALALALLGGVASTALGLKLGWRYGLPILQLLAGYPLMALLLIEQRRGRAIGAMLAWAAAISVTVIVWVAADPARTGAAILLGPSYWQEMRQWLETGVGCESSPRCFLPQHLLHLGLFALAGLASAGIGALAMGAVLMNYMSFYVGQVTAWSREPALAALLAWHPWALARVIGFVILGVLISEPLLRRLRVLTAAPRDPKPLALLALALLVFDAALKAGLAPTWRLLILQRAAWP